MKRKHQCPFLNPSPLFFDFFANDDFVPFCSNVSISPCPFCHRNFERAWIARWFFINMHITLGVPFFIFLVHQNACLKVLGKRCTQIGGHFQASRGLVKMTKEEKELIIGLWQLVSWTIYKVSS